MSPERWALLQQIFDTAIELSPDERRAYLDTACGNDTGLRGEVDALIAANEDADGVIEAVIHGAADLAVETRLDAAGQKIGPYRVVRTVGHGGMGAVYLAERADDAFRQQVAIKVVSATLVGHDTEARFRAERQILASLDHPNIARLIDGGTTDDGVPYLVMEYIRGEPINRFCDQRNLGVNERLELFRRICSAVHYAHQNLVVHRDLKPGNILVTDDGTPKLLDFGIAKILDNKHIEHTVAVTRVGERLLTPEHASPEQLLGRSVTTASDIYSLGILLYELLTGRRPFVISGMRPGQLEKRILEDPPEPPGRVFARRAGAPDLAQNAIAAARGSTPDRLRRRLAGDLDNIVLMALRKEPERRYSSVGQFSDDLRRHLASMPVLARRDTWAYRTDRFVRRHRVGVTMGVLAMLAVIGFGIAMAFQAQRIAAERDEAARQRESADQAVDWLVDIYRYADPGEARGSEITARQLLDNGARRIEAELDDQPQVQARLMDTIGRIYLNLGVYDRANELIDAARQIRAVLFPDGHDDVAESLRSLALLRLDEGHWREAREYADSALSISRALHGEKHLDVAHARHALGRALQSGLALDEAERELTASMDLYASLLGNRHRQVGSVMSDLAQVHREKGDFAGAEALLRRALDIGRSALGPDHPEVILRTTNLALVLHYLGDRDTAESLYRDALAAQQRVLGDRHAHVGITKANLGRLLLERDDFDGAREMFVGALDIDRTARGPGSFLVGYHHANLGQLHAAAGRLDEAEAHFRQALAIYADTPAEERIYEASAMTGLGRVLVDKGLPLEAETLLRGALERWAPDYPNDHWQVWTTRSVLAAALAASGGDPAAVDLMRQSHERLAEKWGEDDRRTRWVRERLAALD